MTADFELRCVRIPSLELSRRFRDAPRFMPLCAACPNFGRQWSCPPYETDETRFEAPGLECAVIDAEVPTEGWTVPDGCDPAAFSKKMLDRVRLRLDAMLIKAESEMPAAAFFAGSCANCPLPECARISGAPCPRPRFMRRSLESCGFDVEAIVRELFFAKLEWAEGGRLPRAFHLVSCLLFGRGTPLPHFLQPAAEAESIKKTTAKITAPANANPGGSATDF